MKYLNALQDYLYRLYQRGYTVDQAAACWREVSRQHSDDSELIEALMQDLAQRQRETVTV